MVSFSSESFYKPVKLYHYYWFIQTDTTRTPTFSKAVLPQRFASRVKKSARTLLTCVRACFFIFPTQRYGSDARSSFLSVLVLKIRQNIQFADLARIGAEGMQLDIVGFKLIEETDVVHQVRIIDQDAL